MPKRQNEVGVSENGGFSPQIIWINRVFHYKPSILGYPYFWKHPCFFNHAPFFFGLGVYTSSPGFRETTSFFGRFWFCWKRFILRRLAAMSGFCLLGGERLSFFHLCFWPHRPVRARFHARFSVPSIYPNLTFFCIFSLFLRCMCTAGSCRRCKCIAPVTRNHFRVRII